MVLVVIIIRVIFKQFCGNEMNSAHIQIVHILKGIQGK